MCVRFEVQDLCLAANGYCVLTAGSSEQGTCLPYLLEGMTVLFLTILRSLWSSIHRPYAHFSAKTLGAMPVALAV